jgi:hypothetical protein
MVTFCSQVQTRPTLSSQQYVGEAAQAFDDVLPDSEGFAEPALDEELPDPCSEPPPDPDEPFDDFSDDFSEDFSDEVAVEAAAAVSFPPDSVLSALEEAAVRELLDDDRLSFL